MKTTAAAALALALCASSAGASVLKVPSDDYPTIQSAVDAAVPGDTIVVSKGIYDEDVSIDAKADLTIRGKGRPVIQPFGIGFAVTGGSEAITITGFEIEGGAVGAQVEASVGVLLSRLFIHDSTQAGIDLSLDTGATISRCVLDTMPTGIQDVTSDFLVIDRCVLTGVAGTGLSLSPDVGGNFGDNHAVVTRNRIAAGSEGIRFGGEDAEISRNAVTGFANFGIELPFATSSDRTVLSRNRVSGEAGAVGIKVASNQSTVSRNVLDGCAIYFDGNGHVVEGNRVANAIWGVYANGNGLTITGNRLSTLSAFGMRVNGTTCTVEGNLVAGVTGNGIEIGGGSNTVDGNRVSGATVNGFDVSGTGNTLTGNRASGSGEFDLRDHNAPAANTYEDNRFGTSQIQVDVIV